MPTSDLPYGNLGSDTPSPPYDKFKVDEVDPRLKVTIKEILLVNDQCVVYIDNHYSLQWYWSPSLQLEPTMAAPIFNRAGDLEAKAQFLRYITKRGYDVPVDMLSAMRLIGQGVVELFSSKVGKYANDALDTADKFVTQRARELSRSWYFTPFLLFFAASTLVILAFYIDDSTMTKEIAIACMFAGGVGAFISRALEE
jgi:hypothetical protein